MSHTATQRLLLQPAPDGLALVQDLLNTRDIGRKVPDLLATAGSAQEWLQQLGEPGDDDWVSELSAGDLAALRVLRTDVRSAVTGTGGVDTEGGRTAVVKTELAILPTGQLRLQPAGTGRRRFASMVWGEVFLAQQTDSWRRLKLCHNPVCGSAFFDRSKNNSGVWHDVKMCGNAANLRASRERQRARRAGG